MGLLVEQTIHDGHQHQHQHSMKHSPSWSTCSSTCYETKAEEEEEELGLVQDDGEESDSTEIIEEVIVIEEDSDDDGEEFQKKLQKKVLMHLKRQQELEHKRRMKGQQQQHRHQRKRRSSKKKEDKAKKNGNSASSDDEMKIKWDLEWEIIKGFTWRTVGFFVPPVVSLPMVFLFRLLFVWPVLLLWRVAVFSRYICVRTWPIIVEFLRSFVRFPKRMVVTVLRFSEGFAYRVFSMLNAMRRFAREFSVRGWSMTWNFLTQVSQVMLRFSKRAKKKLRRVMRKVRRHMMRIILSSYTGIKHLIYIVSLPFRVTIKGILSISQAGRLTFASFTSIPGKVTHFLLNSPTIFGKSGKKFVRFVKKNKQDIIDVFIALIFLTILGMIISGVFFPILANGIRGAVFVMKQIHFSIMHIRLPSGIRIPRLNWAKLREVMPALPFKLPTFPFPDMALLLGLRERTFMEKVAYVFSP